MLITCLGGPSHSKRYYVNDNAHIRRLRFRPPTDEGSSVPHAMSLSARTIEYEIDIANGVAYCITDPELEIKFVDGPAAGLIRKISSKIYRAHCFINGPQGTDVLTRYNYQIMRARLKAHLTNCHEVWRYDGHPFE